MSPIVRPANLQDKSGLEELFKSNPKTFLSYSDDNLLSEIIEKIPEILENPLYFTLVIVVKEEIIGCLLLKEFENQPCWTWGYWNMKPGQINQLFYNDGFNVFRLVSDQMFDEMETKRKLTRFFWAMPHHDNEIGFKTAGSAERWAFSSFGLRFMPRSRNYKFFDDCIIPAGSEARYPYQRAIVGDKIWPIDLKIRMGVFDTSKEEK